MGIVVAAVVLLVVQSCWGPWVAPLPVSADAVMSAEEIAERLRGHLDEDSMADGQPPAASLDGPLMSLCGQGDSLREGPSPQGVPAYSAQLKVVELPVSLSVRFWLAPPAQANGLLETVREAAEGCVHDFTDATIGDYARDGWRGTLMAIAGPHNSDNSDWAVDGVVVAARGSLLAEVSWYWPTGYGEGPDADGVRQGVAAVASVLATVGGDPDGPSPGVTGRTATLAAELPPPSAYGKGVRLWDGVGDPDLTCAIALNRSHLPSAVPVVARTLTGRVTVREEVAVLPDEETAERTRRRLLVIPEDKLKSYDGNIFVTPCNKQEDDQYLRVPYTVEPFTRGPWNGELASLAVRRSDLPLHPTYHDSVAHVTVAVRHGTVVVLLTWQGPAGRDLAGAVREGREAVSRTLDRLS
ncbi:hypothetical protein HCN51_55165 [Nonomuraea sp. FMUSA5-5]|uniref:DUF3558 domain-containing protein n=1 Tax=Nonomuraea composti TaxID=2720023 RepID=A0ABX1BL71_9ACTN|nr:hypothetical protein [Nonomuraea sp. FMUSA5-5]NJP98470.1 hypothetical protein [Nonomuraea sp. FMUSA5-5]